MNGITPFEMQPNGKPVGYEAIKAAAKRMNANTPELLAAFAEMMRL